jgi:hypothetical protein
LRFLSIAGVIYLAVTLLLVIGIAVFFFVAERSRPDPEFEARVQQCLAEVRSLRQQGYAEDAAYAEANTRPVCQGLNLRVFRSGIVPTATAIP